MEQNPLTEIYIEAHEREALCLKKIIPVTDVSFYPPKSLFRTDSNMRKRYFCFYVKLEA
jgi:hypothetical protein